MNDPTIHQNEPRILAENVSFEDFVRDYEGQRVEWHAGKVIEKVSNNEVHQTLLGFLHILLNMYLRMTKRGRVYTDGYPMFIREAVPAREPDLMVILNENLERIQHTHLQGPADFVLEIVSPATGSVDRGEKFYEYQTAGVPEYWIVDPINREIIAYRLTEDGRYQRIEPNQSGQVVSVVLPGFFLSAAWLWEGAEMDMVALVELVNTMVQA